LEAPVHDSRIVPSVRYQNQYVPYVLCGFISPWNFPVTLSLIDAAPALMAGSAVLIKPSEVTPRFAEPLIRAIAAVPELAAVCGIVLGDGETGAALVDSVDLICFTGSVPTGRKVGEAAARRFIPAFLELGGKDPVIVLEGADIEAAADAVLRGALANSGQACLSIERVYVQRPIFTYFLERLVAKAQTVGLNWPDIDRGHLGPIIFPRQAETLRRHLEDARARGAKIHTGGEIEHHGGLWMGATIVSDVTHDMALMREESFGPVIPVMAFDDVEEAIALANDTEYGLSGAVFASSIEAARLVAERMNAGGVSLNDCALTIVTYEPEKTSFGYSGLGGSRMGPGSIYRFVRKKALIMQSGRPAGLEVIAEAEAAPP
jgi:acyl-CoA reductase-like NAD-dependent aldehyde dehydrogenase